MAGRRITVALGAGGFAAVVATVALCFSVPAGNAPEPTIMGLLVAGLVVLAIGLVSNFEHQSRLWADQMEAERQARRRGWQLAMAAPPPGPSTG